MSKAYLITGASSGIGASCARRMASQDTTLFLVGRNKERLENVANELPGHVFQIAYDLSDLSGIRERIFGPCLENKIKLSGMIYSAGVNADCPVKAIQPGLMMEAMTVNCLAFLEISKHFYSKKFSEDGASIVAISSIASLTCDKGMVLYSASKAALNASVRTMAKEYVRRRIRVNAILPGGVDTPMAQNKMRILSGDSIREEGEKKQEDPQPLGLIPAEIIAEQAAYLMSDASAYTTGELMVIGGGRAY